MPSNQLEAILLCGCGCGEEAICCPSRCYPGSVHSAEEPTCTGDPSENPLPSTLTIEMTTDDITYGCFEGSTTVTLVANGRWGLGTINSTCVWLDPTDSTKTKTWYFCFQVAIQCTPGNGWGIEFRRCASVGTPSPDFIPSDSLLTRVSCNPILLAGTVCFLPGMSSVVFPAVPPQPPMQHPTICLNFLVYETL